MARAVVATCVAVGAFVGACGTAAAAAFLPAQLTPPDPFPLVLEQSLEREFVAPGVERATYRLQTSAGPVVVSLVVFDPHEPSLHIGTVLARDRMVSSGETVSSMAARTGAVAGVNADYFDIGNTNSPLGVLIQNGALVRTPSSRTAFTVGVDKSIAFAPVRIDGTAIVNGRIAIPVTSVNTWPPEGGAAFVTPTYGVPPAAAGTVVAELTPVGSAMPVAARDSSCVPPALGAAPPGGRYLVTQIDTGTAPAAPTYALALGAAAQSSLTALPDVGDLIDVAFAAEPSFDRLVQAIGGGPALLQNGMPVDDPVSPGYAGRARRIPAAAAATLRDGGGIFAVVDGRHHASSVGVNRAELIALLMGLGAADAMEFDGGGSATLVARVLGDDRATVVNEPSDGVERPVADGVFLYSDAPAGPPARLVVRPSAIVALPATAIGLRSTVVDAAGHPLHAAIGPWRIEGAGATIGPDDVLHVADAVQTTLHLTRDGVSTDLPLEVVPEPSRITIAPDHPDIDPNASIALQVRAFGARGEPLAIGDHVRWSALRGAISDSGTFEAGDRDGFVTATIGSVQSSEIVHVGRHREPLPRFDAASQALWHFSSIPAGGPGAVAFTPQGTLHIGYDFHDTERAAYANAGVPLGEALALSCAIDGDGGGAGVRIALLDGYGERSTLTLAKSVDWTGLQRHDVTIPGALEPPLALQSFYVIGSLGSAPVKSAGTIGIRSCEIVQPGSAPEVLPSRSPEAPPA